MTTTGSLVVRTDVMDRPIYEAKFRHEGRQVKRRLGHAFLEPDGDGWIEPKGKVPDGLLSRDAALVAMRDTIAAWEAQQAVLKARASADGSDVETFADAAHKWLARAERRGRKISTVTDYRYAVEGYLTPGVSNSRLGIPRAPFAALELSELTGHEGSAIVGAWFDVMPSGRTKEKLGMIVNSILKLSVAQGWATDNVMDRVDREPVKYDPSEYDIFTTIEIEKLIANAKSERDALIYSLASFGGLRCGEVLALRWEDVEFPHHRLRVAGNVSYGKRATTKSGKGRTVPLVSQLAARLEAYREPSERHGLIFPGSFGADFLDPSTLRRRYAVDVKRAGLRHLPLHSLRHFFASVAVNNASLVQTRDWLGHADLRTTSRYLHSKSHSDDADTLGRGFAA